MLITGGAGFIGSNAALYFGKRGWDICILDNLSRAGTSVNLESLQQEMNVSFVNGDIRRKQDVDNAFRQAGNVDAVLHMAAQVAVTTSVLDPTNDFEVNALGTFNILEATRSHAPGARFVFASTNKVYGNLEHRRVVLSNGRYSFDNLERGVNEQEPLDFHSPYGCSKGAADQYVADYARMYGLKTYVIRQSCIYGPRQYGVEDQGWVAWFTIAAHFGRNITVYGDGKQVRDLLWVEDLLDLYDRCLESGRPGSVYNAGGGVENVASILEVLKQLESLLQRKIPINFADWRPGDQKIFVSDNGKAGDQLSWKPRRSVSSGLEVLVRWVQQNEALIKKCGL